MTACPQCGAENREEARFCDSCGAALLAAPEGTREERKVVSVLFADLVGFTGRAEQMDPEDVRTLLSPYYAHVRAELERFGGTVEKFIGDAVMALFGAPVAHEDDPERAVRAAVTIRDWAREQGEELHLRVAVTTGEALVALGARPSEGEGMASGDVVNTAARLQAAAPIDGILVDETTYRATSQAIEYKSAEPVSAKGKVDPVPAWEAVEARSRFGVDTAQAPRAPLIGRDRELGVLVDALARAREQSAPQLVTLVGVPGMGKSRLVYELFQAVERDPDLIYWRQGRSLPYGEGISFWALGEMVKAQAGILETDAPEETEKKLSQSVHDLVHEADVEWVERYLGTLVGTKGDQELRGDHRAEAFAAWRRYLEAIAEDRPLVLVFEDLHWADEGLLEFIDHLVDWAAGVPILVVCTARPELLSRHPHWGGGKTNATALSLSPLDDEQTARLLAELLDRSVLPAETQSALLQRAGGNPLYAEEFVRMMSDRDLVVSDEHLPLPESVQGIVAARLDALSVEEKTLLQDAAVIGKVFWLGAGTEISGLERAAAESALHQLERKEFVRRERRSSVAGENEYAFRHVLVRDVAYGQIPRALRAEKHRLAAEWIEALGRPEDHAEMLAHHYATALELGRAAGADTGDIVDRARAALREAGERAYALGAYAAADRFYGAAVELWPETDSARPELLFRYAQAKHEIESWRATDLLTEARDALLEAGDSERAAEAEILLTHTFWLQTQRDRAFEHLEAAEALVDGEPTSYSKAYVVSNMSRFRMLSAESEHAIRLGRQALAMAEELGLDEIRAHALNNIGCARMSQGDTGGIDDLQESVKVAEALNSTEGVRAYGNLATMLTQLGELERAGEMYAEGRRLAERFGLTDFKLWMAAESLKWLYYGGQWDEAARELDELIARFEQTPFWMDGPCRITRGQIRLARGDTKGGEADATRSLELAREAKDPQVLWPALAFAAFAFHRSDSRRAGEFAKELLALIEERGLETSEQNRYLLDLCVALHHLGREQGFLEAAAQVRLRTPWVEAATAVASGDFASAADVYGSIGALPQEAYARLRAAQSLVEDGRRAEAEPQLQRSLDFWRSVGAAGYLREGETLLAASA